MKSAILVLLATGALAATSLATAAARSATTKGVANAALAAAGRNTALKDIDYGQDHCDGALTVAAWLTALAGSEARAIAWTGGACRLVNELNPLDSGGGWCAQATVSLAHPKRRDDTPMIEIYFEKLDHGRPGQAYAFRSVMMTRADGPDYLRFRQDFEAEWRDRFPTATAPSCRDAGD